MERVMLDEDFQQLAREVEPEELYELIEVLNKAQQEMRWTNHPRIFLEVAIVKLCQLEQRERPGQAADIKPLMQQIEQLQHELAELKKNGIAVKDDGAPAVQKKPQRSSRKGFQAPVGKVNEVLKQATKNDLVAVKSRWGEMPYRSQTYAHSSTSTSHWASGGTAPAW